MRRSSWITVCWVTGDWDNQSEHDITRRDRWKRNVYLSHLISFQKEFPVYVWPGARFKKDKIRFKASSDSMEFKYGLERSRSEKLNLTWLPDTFTSFLQTHGDEGENERWKKKNEALVFQSVRVTTKIWEVMRHINIGTEVDNSNHHSDKNE